VEKRLRPVGAAVDCEMLVTMHTSRQPARGFVDRIQALEGHDGILSISVSHGFAWGDTEHMGTQVLVYADGDAAKAKALARKLADELIGLREQLRVHFPSIDEALDEALAFDGGPVVLADSADNPGGGASGDSTFILRRLLERHVGNACIGPLWDPVAARIAFEAGPGATLALRIGGKIGPLSGDPVDAVCTVKAVCAEMKMTGLAGTPMAMGDSVLVEIEGSGGVEIVLISLRNQAMGTDLFTQLGCDLAAKKIVVVKSSQHFYASFSKVARHVIYAGAPGAVTLDLDTLPYRKIRRPKWPLR
jgi:microcystin degradation protein MlrC